MQPSSPHRHSTELVQLIRENFSSDGQSSSKPVMIILSDGVQDHRVTYGLAMIAHFCHLNLDAHSVCKCVRTKVGPTQLTLNLALQNVSLMRDKMSDPLERAIKYKNTINAIWSVVEDIPELEAALLESTSLVISLLSERFIQMKLKGFSIKICPAATQDDIMDNFDFIDSSLTMGKLQQENLKDAAGLKAFMNEHCHSSHYLYYTVLSFVTRYSVAHLQYYSGAFPPVCWYCVSPEEMLTDDEFMQNLESQYAQYVSCVAQKANALTSHVAKRSKKQKQLTDSVPSTHTEYLNCF